MAIIKNGIFGKISGRMGDKIYSNYKGTQVVKKLPARRKTAPTPAQLKQQVKFALLMGFLKPVKSILNKAFEKTRLPMTAFNKAFSNNLNAITGIYPDYQIDYANVSLCKGAISNPNVIMVEANSEGKLILSLNRDSLYSIAAIWTLFFIAAYEEESKRWIYTMNPASIADQTYEIDLSQNRSKSFHVYAGFMPATGASTISLYTGRITVQ
ncbi:MAG TPA: DUF6266 family protein [Puia sp.]|nr:DUF6266 family protein [Puia sp.]